MLGGIKNARSFQPSDTFGITTFDRDGVSIIDVGFNKNVATTKAGDITFTVTERGSTKNGDVVTYTILLKSSIPILVGDVLKFTVPEGIFMNANADTICTPINADDAINCGISG